MPPAISKTIFIQRAFPLPTALAFAPEQCDGIYENYFRLLFISILNNSKAYAIQRNVPAYAAANRR